MCPLPGLCSLGHDLSHEAVKLPQLSGFEASVFTVTARMAAVSFTAIPQDFKV